MRRTACLLFAVAVALGTWAAPAARADVFDDNPATVSRAPGDTWVFVRAPDGAVYERHRLLDGSWSEWSSLGGSVTSGPAAVSFNGVLNVFARGTDGTVQQTWIKGDGTWAPWISLGGYTLSAPAVNVRRGDNFLDLVVRGGDSQMYHQAYVPGTGWSGFAPIGGLLTSAATVNSQADHLLNIWSRGTDAQMYQKSWTGSAWTEWGALGGGLDGAPTSISRAENVIDIYVKGAGGGTYQRSWTPGAWSDWIALDPSPIDSAPAAGADTAQHEYLFARRGNEVLYKQWTAGIGWVAWTSLGVVALPPPPAAPPPSTAPLPDGSASLETGLRCTPVNGKLRVSVKVRKPSGKSKPRVTKIVFFTKGKGRRIVIDRRSPFEVRIKINRPAASTGRVYARVYYKRSAHGKTYRKVVSRRYKVCR
jgi:hypothetical protein